MSDNILTQIKSQYEYFTRVEKSIADLVLKDPHKFVTYSTSTVAKLCGVSQGSINNFARKFTPKGFSFFKLSIARCVSYDKERLEAEIPETEGEIKSTMDFKVREYISALCHTLEINDDDILKSAAEKIFSAKRIAVLGVFQSGVVAKNLSYKLIQLGIPSSYENDALMFAVNASTLTKDDLVITISSSGTTKEVIDAVSIAKEKGVKIVSLTANGFSPLAKLSDDVLLTAFGNGKDRNKIDNVRMSQLLIVDTLYTYIRKRVDPNGEKSKNISRIISLHNI